jgi:hypothetical protein
MARCTDLMSTWRLQGNFGPTGRVPGECEEGTQVLILRDTNYLAGPLTFMQKAAAPPFSLSRLAVGAGMEVDDLAAQFFRRPLLFRRLEICRNVEFNQFRHHILLAGNRMPLSRVLQESPQKSQSVQAHVSLVPYSCSSKLNATNRNTEIKAEFFADMREKTQVS